MIDFIQLVYKWFIKNRRDLPWRSTKDPYKIWISEIILQQTRVQQGLDYYYSFIEEFPDINALAEAQEQQVLKKWQGLGYYSRARNLHASARLLKTRYGSQFPRTYSEILSLKGIGPYTAAAIASIAFDLPYPVLDGNVHRILARYFGISDPSDTPEGKRRFQKTANEIMPQKDTGFHNEALMEFGALQCIPHNPRCASCPLNASCYAFINQKVESLPARKKKNDRRIRYLNFYLIENGKYIWLEKRTADDIWKNLYQFPAAELPSKLAEEEAIAFLPSFLNGCSITVKSISAIRKHVLSHQTLFARLIHVEASGKIKTPAPYLKIAKHEFSKFPVPRLIGKLLENLENHDLKV